MDMAKKETTAYEEMRQMKKEEVAVHICDTDVSLTILCIVVPAVTPCNDDILNICPCPRLRVQLAGAPETS